jgi:cytochrome c oxidase subunit III
MKNMVFKRREPFTFMLYLGIVGSSLLFLFIFFVFIQKETRNQNIPLALPKAFWFSTLAMLISSFLLMRAKVLLDHQLFQGFRMCLGFAFSLGLLFLILQVWAWQSLLAQGLTMANHTGASFLYILSALHVVHTLGGVVALGHTLGQSFRNRQFVDAFVYSVNPPNQLRLKLVSIYWHFLDIIWLVIFVFLCYHAL